MRLQQAACQPAVVVVVGASRCAPVCKFWILFTYDKACVMRDGGNTSLNLMNVIMCHFDFITFWDYIYNLFLQPYMIIVAIFTTRLGIESTYGHRMTPMTLNWLSVWLSVSARQVSRCTESDGRHQSIVSTDDAICRPVLRLVVSRQRTVAYTLCIQSETSPVYLHRYNIEFY